MSPERAETEVAAVRRSRYLESTFHVSESPSMSDVVKDQFVEKIKAAAQVAGGAQPVVLVVQTNSELAHQVYEMRKQLFNTHKLIEELKERHLEMKEMLQVFLPVEG